jgi:hypothetical protein
MIVSVILEWNIGKDFESVANLWIANKRHSVMNVVSSAVPVLCTIWKLRNDLCFQGTIWLGMKPVIVSLGRMLRRWLAKFKLEIKEKLEVVIQQLVSRANAMPQIKWRQDTS